MPSWIAGEALDVGIVCRDAASMLRFYEEGLGLARCDEIQVPGVTIVFLRCGAARVKLLCLDDVPAAANPEPPHLAATGIRYVTFDVVDLEPVLAACEAHGGRVVRRGTHENREFAFVTDPDGNPLELVHRR